MVVSKLPRTTAFSPYLFLILSNALSNFSCFSFLRLPIGVGFVLEAVSGANRSNKLSCTGSEGSHSLEVRIPNKRIGVPFHNSLNKRQAVSYIKVVELVAVGRVVW